MKYILSLICLSLWMIGCEVSQPTMPAIVPTPTPIAIPQVTLTPGSAPLPNNPAPEHSQVSTPRPHRLKPGELLLAAEEDAIPAIFANDDLFVGAAAGSQEWSDDEPVVGLVVGEDARAYPVRLLSLHEIVNDVVGGRPVAITWCPLCYTSLVFDRTVGRELTFGVSGYLFHNNLVMYDHQTNTLWSQLLAQGIRGALRGRRLEVLPALLTTWGAWKQAHPETRVLSAARLGRHAEEIIDPYAGYYTSGVSGLTGSADKDERLSGKALIVGLVAGEQARAYPLRTVQDAGVINDQLGPLPIVLAYDERLQTVLVYRRRVNGQTLTFAPASKADLLRDAETGSSWEVRNGRATEGPLAGAELTRLSGPLVFWFAWSAHYPDTEVYAP